MHPETNLSKSNSKENIITIQHNSLSGLFFLNVVCNTIKLFETLTSKPRIPMWVKKINRNPSKETEACIQPWAQPLIEPHAATSNYCSQAQPFLSLYSQLSKEGQVVLRHFLGLQIK